MLLLVEETTSFNNSWVCHVYTTIQFVKLYIYTPIAFDERVNASGHCLLRVRLLHCMRVRLRNGYTQAYALIMQHTHTHKAVTGRIEAKKLLSCRRRSNYSSSIFPQQGCDGVIHDSLHQFSSFCFILAGWFYIALELCFKQECLW